MPCGAASFQDDICTVDLDADLLTANGELRVCLAQPSAAGSQVIAQDGDRPGAIALANAIFSEEAGRPQLARWFGQSNGLLVFPEYAFSSKDFSALDSLIRGYPHPLILLAGFGAVRGDRLRSILEECAPTWSGGAGEIDPQQHYNGGWCWIRDAAGNQTCYVFLKNYFEQRVEIALLDEPARGTHILQIVARDLVIYPLICADLICDTPNSPQSRISKSLPRTHDNRADLNKRVLVVALLYTPEPHHPLWPPSINRVVELHERKAGLFTVNQLVSRPQADIEKDKWRCLTGGFISRHVMADPPNPSLKPVRYVRTEHASGLILRNPMIGVASGSFRWVDGANQGRNVWYPDCRRFLRKGELLQASGSVAQQEFRRYLTRNGNAICARYHESSKPILQVGIHNLGADEAETFSVPRLWAKLLTGVEDPPPPHDPEQLDAQAPSLDPAIATLAAVQQATGAEPLSGRPHSGQLLWGEREILVWKSPTYDWVIMHSLLEESAVGHPFERQLTVLGSGCRGLDSPACRIEPGRFANFAQYASAGDFTEPRTRHIYWQPLGAVENVLLDRNSPTEEKRTAIIQHLSEN